MTADEVTIGGIYVTPELLADEKAFSAWIVPELREMLARYPIVAVRLDRRWQEWTREQIQGTGEGVPVGLLPSQPLKKGEIVIVNGRRAVVDGTYELQQAKLVEVSELRR